MVNCSTNEALQQQSFCHQICYGFVELLVSYQQTNAEGGDHAPRQDECGAPRVIPGYPSGFQPPNLPAFT